MVDLYQQVSSMSQEYFCNILLTKITEDNENYQEYCLILYELARTSPRSLEYIVDKGVIGRYLENIVRKNPRVFVDKLEILPDEESEIGNEVVF